MYRPGSHADLVSTPTWSLLSMCCLVSLVLALRSIPERAFFLYTYALATDLSFSFSPYRTCHTSLPAKRTTEPPTRLCNWYYPVPDDNPVALVVGDLRGQ
ncbi:hypothetical protein EDD17DRAFT_463510 [Pisolithus thermaeus]|nr:hypothetical protein EDD17DRAFT_463510 [Pisolithus thermaeus]